MRIPNMSGNEITQKSKSFESLADILSFWGYPKATLLNKPLFKKMFLDHASMDVTDKKALKDDVEKIRWLYTLKPSTINISAYQDESVDYPEIAILHITLNSGERAKRINQFINRAIPYPVVALFTIETEPEETNEDEALAHCSPVQFAIAVTDKRNHKVNKEKWVLEENIITEWIPLEDINTHQASFINSLKLVELPFTNFLGFYQAITQRLVALKTALHTGNFTLENNSATIEKEDSEGIQDNRLLLLRELEQLEISKQGLSQKLKKEKQMGKRVDLSVEIKKSHDKQVDIKTRL
jgi:hypothetical protein